MQNTKKPLQKIWYNIPIALSVLGVAFAVFNIFLATRLFPVVQSIGNLDFRVSAVEHYIDGKDALVSEFRVVQQQIKELGIDVSRLEGGQLRLENKIDTLLLR